MKKYQEKVPSQDETHQVLLCDLTHVGQRIASDSFPLGIASIATYLETKSTIPVKTTIVKFPGEVYEAYTQIQPRIVGFSNYMWNADLGRKMAGLIKQVYPETITIFGGPNFPLENDAQEKFLKENEGVIDFYIKGEGEVAFLKLVQNLIQNGFDIEAVKEMDNPSVLTLKNGTLHKSALAERINSLEDIPSPYLSGKMDSFFGKNLMPLIQTVRGCPFACTYCVEGDGYYNSVVKKKELHLIEEELEYIAERAKDNKQLFIADSNFGMYKDDVDTAKVIEKVYSRRGYPSFIQVATGKNQKQRILQVAEILKGKIRLSGSVQSLDPIVLENVKRKNISGSQILEIAKEADKTGANSYSEIILGLPGDSLQAHLDTMKQIIEAGFNFVLPWTCILLEGSELATEENVRKYGIEKKYRVLPRCFGQYRFGAETFISAEIEAVSAVTNTLPLDDYLECRMFTLTTALFFNDKFFEEALETVKSAGLSPYDWLSEIHNSSDAFPEKVKRIYQDFRLTTTNELWESKKELEEFIQKDGILEKYIKGELGMNVMYYYRAKALLEVMPELNDIAFESLHKLLVNQQQKPVNEIKAYLQELKTFCLARKNNFFDVDESYELSFRYDFVKIQKLNQWQQLGNELDNGEYRYRFLHTEDQKKHILQQIDVFGNDISGLAKVLSRIHIGKIYRTVEKVT